MRSEQRPARAPDATGTTRRGDVALHYAVYGSALHGRPPATVLLLPTWSIVDSRIWKLQIAFLARHHRVITFDGRGTGASSRPACAAAYRDAEYAADTVAVLDATDTEQAVLVGYSCGSNWAIRVAADHPERVRGVVAISSSCGFALNHTEVELRRWEAEPAASPVGWQTYNRHYWRDGHLDDFRKFFFTEMFPEPHSTKQIEDVLSWSAAIDAETLAATTAARLGGDGVARETLDEFAARVRCPVEVLHGTEDHMRHVSTAERLAELTGGRLTVVEGAGHAPIARDPVRVNRLIHEFVERVSPTAARRAWTRAARRPRRALYLSSPIGLGHARRDVAIATELRKCCPDVEITWLAQHPVTEVLAAAGETVHPAARWLLGETAHIEAESGEHDLHAFEAIRRMDEILVANFMLFDEITREEPVDLVIGDEAWEVDYFLHENPELKRTALAWLTDFVGWLPMPDGGSREAALAADYNLEMLEQRARYPRLRDLSIFVGNPDDVVPDRFGTDLPSIRDWTVRNFEFSGYVTGGPAPTDTVRRALRRRLGLADGQRLCVVTVGGTCVGDALLHRVLDAVPTIRRRIPDLHVLLVTGPRIDPATLPRRRGVRVRGFVPDLTNYLAACDVAVVQGGLSTCMELAAAETPFVYVPLEHHFEQNFHVRHRLDRYGAGTLLRYREACDPDRLADAVTAALTGPTVPRSVETDGAARAAAMLAELLCKHPTI
ncbi:MAG TPA: alpha/beta fold hydrolase [Aldersonia sp.]